MANLNIPPLDAKVVEKMDQEAAEIDSVHEKEAERAELMAVTPRTALHNAYRGRHGAR